jgi:hypothetical protein
MAKVDTVMVVANLIDNSEENGRSELKPGHLYIGITFGGLAWMGGEGAEGGGRRQGTLSRRRETWRLGRTWRRGWWTW